MAIADSVVRGYVKDVCDILDFDKSYVAFRKKQILITIELITL